ncbi:hypothetical protein D3C72_1177570 [compost metagenome]
MIGQSLNKISFSSIFCTKFKKPSSCAEPILVKIPIFGLMIFSSLTISLTVEIPASKIPKLCFPLMAITESGTPT